MKAGFRAVVLLGAALVVTAERVAAQMSIPGWGNFARNRQHFSTRAAVRASQHMPRDRLTTTPLPRPYPSAPAAGLTTFRTQAAELAPALLAAEVGRSRADRAAAQKNFSEVLKVYRDRLRSAGGAQNDVARAAAWMVSNSYGVYHGRILNDAQFAAVRWQFETAWAADPSFQRKGDRERQVEFELYAILGTAVTLDDPSQRARLRQLASENLMALFGVPPERIAITNRGVEIRAARTR